MVSTRISLIVSSFEFSNDNNKKGFFYFCAK